LPTTYFHRHSIRLRGYDYHQAGAYFITLAAVHHEEVFGFRNEEQVNLNDFGKVIAFSWQELPRHFPLSLDEWIVMPDHLHAIVFLETRAGENDPLISGLGAGTQADSLGAVIQNY
jgi:putative transposase